MHTERNNFRRGVIFIAFACSILGCLAIANLINRHFEKERWKPDTDTLHRQYREDFSLKGFPILISRYDVNKSDHSGYVDVQFIFENLSDKVIKYIYFEVIPYDEVEDISPDQISGKSLTRLSVVGPLKKYECKNISFENIWYAPAVKYVVLHRIEIIYMDGDTVVIGEDQAMNLITEKEVI